MAHRTKRATPTDPAAIRRLRRAAEQYQATERQRRTDPAQWGVARDALRLAANSDVEALDAAGGKVARIRRYDVFALLAARASPDRPFPEAAVRRLQNDMAVLHRTVGLAGEIHVQGGVDPAMMSARRIESARLIDAVLHATGPMSERLLRALCEADVVHGRTSNWRAIVRAVTGEIHDHGQTALVRAACENLAAAYSAIDQAPRKVRVAA